MHAKNTSAHILFTTSEMVPDLIQTKQEKQIAVNQKIVN
jgi:hypothetical protein